MTNIRPRFDRVSDFFPAPDNTRYIIHIMEILNWLGRQKSRAIATLVLIGILLPPVGAVLKPFLTEAVFGLLVMAFLRINTTSLRLHIKKPAMVIGAVAWTTVAIPMLVVAVMRVLGLATNFPELFLGIMLQAMASPMMSTPALAALMGLDATLVLIVLVGGTALTPLSAPLFAMLAGLELSITPTELGLKLFAVLGGSAILGLGIRRLLGPGTIANHHEAIDGINILLLFVFVSAMMVDVGGLLLTSPWLVISMTGIAFGVFGALLAISFVVFRATGSETAFTLGMMTSQRNMGLMLAGTGGVVPDITWLYFALSQLPVYLSPQLLSPVVRRVKKTVAIPEP